MMRTVTKPSAQAAPLNDYLSLGKHDVHAFKRVSQTLHIISGDAWVTFDGEDVILYAGEELLLVPGDDLALISAIRTSPLVYTVA